MSDFIQKILQLTTSEKWDEYIQNCTYNELPRVYICDGYKHSVYVKIHSNSDSIAGEVLFNDEYSFICVQYVASDYNTHPNIKQVLKGLIDLWIKEGGFKIERSSFFKNIRHHEYQMLTYTELHYDTETRRDKKILWRKECKDKITITYNNDMTISQIKIKSNRSNVLTTEDQSDHIVDKYMSTYLKQIIDTNHNEYDIQQYRNKMSICGKKRYDCIILTYNHNRNVVEIKIKSDNITEYISEYLQYIV